MTFIQSTTSNKHWRPWPYQKRMVKWLLEHGGAGLFMQPGMGKTAIVLAALRELKAEGAMERALVIAPLRVCYNVWPDEIRKWGFGLRIEILHGPKKDKAVLRDADVYVCNPEAMPWLTKQLAALGADTLVVDESTKFKDTRTQRFRMLKPFLNSFRRRWILTGTPVSNGYLDLFGQAYIADQGQSLGPYITHYRQKYFYQLPVPWPEWRLLPGSEKQIQKKMKTFAVSMAAKDYLDLPELINNTVRVDLPEKARKIYDDMEEQMIADLEDGNDVRAVSASAASQKCRQIANGAVYRQEFRDERMVQEWSPVHDAKIEALLEIIEESSAPVMVVYEFRHDMERILKVLPKTPVIGGGTTAKQAERTIAGWNSKQFPILLIHPASAGHGLNLQGGGDSIVFFGIPFDYELYSQTIQRVHRQGAKFKNVVVHHIVARRTVDDAKMRALDSKATSQDKFMAALRSYAHNRRLEKALESSGC